MTEQWKPFANGNYAISDHGRVKRLTEGRKTWPGFMLKLNVMKVGYHGVAPVIDGKNVQMFVHHLVAEHFIGPRPDGKEINHKDGVKTNNHVDNLEYVTHGDNMRHAASLGLINFHRPISESTVRTIRTLREKGHSFSQLVSMTGVSIGHCWAIVNRTKRKEVV